MSILPLAPRHIVKSSPRGQIGWPYRDDDVVVAFGAPLPFDAMRVAERWLQEQGFAVGPNRGGDPRGIRRTEGKIKPWRHLAHNERWHLDGIMLSPDGVSMRQGPITVRLRKQTAPEVSEAGR